MNESGVTVIHLTYCIRTRCGGRYARLVAEAPADHGMDYVHCYAVIEKV